jgi:PhnB protein
MAIETTTHLNFRGTARDALGFYQSVFGGHLVAVTYADAHAVQNPTEADQIMWGQVASPDGFRVMAYDVPSSQPYHQGENAVFVSVRGKSPDEISAYWGKLTEGSTIIVPLAAAAWSPLYGMVRDRFGITWVLDIAVEYAG